MKQYLIYTNDNGTDAYLMIDNETPEEKYKKLLDECGDDYFFTQATFVAIENNTIVECFSVGIPELEML